MNVRGRCSIWLILGLLGGFKLKRVQLFSCIRFGYRLKLCVGAITFSSSKDGSIFCTFLFK